MTRRLAATALLLALAGTAPGQNLEVRRMAAGVTTSPHSGSGFLTNTFDAPVAASNTTGAYINLSAGSTGVATGTYTAAPPAGSPAGYGFGVFSDVYGGQILTDGTRDNYFSTGGRTGPNGSNYLASTATLGLSQTAYSFGFYWMALDPTNSVRFYSGGVNGTLVGTVTANQLLTDVGVLNDPDYGGTLVRAANGTVTRTNPNEKYVYVNVYSKTAGAGFDTVVFDNSTGGSGFESDSHTLGTTLLDQTAWQGMVLVPVPEPAAGLLAAAAVGVWAWRRRG